MKEENEDNLLTVDQAAKYLKVSKSALYGYIKHDGLETIRLSGKTRGPLRIRASVLEEWLRNRTIKH